MVMRPGSRLLLLTIALLVLLTLQQRTPLIPPAFALRSLNDSLQMQSASLPSTSNATPSLPDPSNCEPPETTHMGTFFSARSSKGQHNYGENAVDRPSLASNLSKAENSTSILCGNLNGNVSECGNISSSAEHKSSQEQNQARDMKSYNTVSYVDEQAAAHVDPDAAAYEIASLHVVVKDKDDVVLVEEEGSASNLSTDVADSEQVMVVNDDDAVLVDAEQVEMAATTQSAAKDSVQVMEVDKDDIVFVDVERLGGPSPPPGSDSIHTAAGSSIARQAVHVMDFDKASDVFRINERGRLADATPPPSDTTIHTAAQSSVARESMQVMEIAKDADAGLVSSERLGHATPPPIDTSIHTADQRSAAREAVQVVLETSADGIDNEEQLVASTPPPGNSDIHTASQRSVARDSDLRVHFQHDESRHIQYTLRR